MSATVSPLSFSSTSSPAGDSTSSALPMQSLNESDFLQLLATQMSSQDPMNPMTDTAFISQMAQFTSLQQTNTMSNTMTQMNNSQQMLQASSLIGSTVQLVNADGTTTSGSVQSVQVQSGTPTLMVNGQGYNLSQVISIAPTATTPTTTTP